MNRLRSFFVLILILILGVALRLTAVNWDSFEHFHPDERYITWVATTIEAPQSWQELLLPKQSTVNPFYWSPRATSEGIEVPQNEPRSFAYGHFPLYLGVAATRLAEGIAPALIPQLPADWAATQQLLNGDGRVEFIHLTAVSRALTGLIDVGTILLIFLLGQQLFNTNTGLLAAAFLAVTVTHIQLAHFFAFDPYLTFFAVAALWLIATSLPPRGNNVNDQFDWREKQQLRSQFLLIGAAICVGLAIGSKFAGVLLLLPLVTAAWFVGRATPIRWGITAVFTTFLTFAFTNPFALLDFGCEAITPAVQLGPLRLPALNWGSCFLQNIGTQGSMVRGITDVPFVRQYLGTTPYLYYIEMQLRWGMGWLLGIIAFIGFGWIIWNQLRQLEFDNHTIFFDSVKTLLRSPITLSLAWVIPFFISTGNFYVKFMRYLQPIVPFLILFGAAWLLQLRWQRVRVIVTTAVFLLTTLYALSYVNMLRDPHPWVSASEWLFSNAPTDSLILSELWDDSLPTNLIIDGQPRSRREFEIAPLSWLTPTDGSDNATKLAENLILLEQADFVTINSNRNYGVVPRLPERYPISHQYHQLLFDGQLGYELVSINGRFPHLGPLHLRPDTFRWPGLTPPTAVQAFLNSHVGLSGGRADESFIVYDQPLTLIFQNVEQKTASDMLAEFELP